MAVKVLSVTGILYTIDRLQLKKKYPLRLREWTFHQTAV